MRAKPDRLPIWFSSADRPLMGSFPMRWDSFSRHVGRCVEGVHDGGNTSQPLGGRASSACKYLFIHLDLLPLLIQKKMATSERFTMLLNTWDFRCGQDQKDSPHTPPTLMFDCSHKDLWFLNPSVWREMLVRFSSSEVFHEWCLHGRRVPSVGRMTFLCRYLMVVTMAFRWIIVATVEMRCEF